jgi:putative PIN family toxin of toxin-antitoxin system
MTGVVLDTNVLAPGFVGATSTSARLIHLWRAGRFELVVSEHLLGELARTFADPYYRARVSPDHVNRILTLLRAEARFTSLTVPVSGVATHPEDDLILSTGLSAGAIYLATRDRQLLKLESYQGLQIVLPGRLLADLESREIP